MNRLLSRLRHDAGALTQTLVFTMIGTAIVSLMASWIVFRVEADRYQQVQAQLAQSIGALAETILVDINKEHIGDLGAGRSFTRAFPQTQSTARATNITRTAEGAITARITATSTTPRGWERTQEVTFEPVGVAVYLGQAAGRPQWLGAEPGQDSLAYYRIAYISDVP